MAVAAVPVARLVTTRATLPASRVVRIRLACARGATCRGSVRLRTAQAIGRPGRSRARVTLGAASFRIGSGSRRTLRIRVSGANARALRAARRVRVTVLMNNRDAAGSSVASRGKLTLSVRR